MATDEILKGIGEATNQIIGGGAYRAAVYLNDKTIIKATRKLYKGGWKKRDSFDIVLTIGKPNYEERERIKQAKKAGTGPIGMTIKFPPKRK